MLIVIAIIGILAAIALPAYRQQTIKAKMAEAVNAMEYIASAMANHRQELVTTGEPWPNCPDAAAIQTTLGLGVLAVSRMSTVQVDPATGTIQATLTNIDGTVDGQTLSLTPTRNVDGSISWTWNGTVPTVYLPKR